jgi:hypothetical protein
VALTLIAVVVIDSVGWSAMIACVYTAFRGIILRFIAIIIPILRLVFRYGLKKVYPRVFPLNMKVVPFLFCSFMKIFPLMFYLLFGSCYPDLKGRCPRFLSGFEENAPDGAFSPHRSGISHSIIFLRESRKKK